MRRTLAAMMMQMSLPMAAQAMELWEADAPARPPIFTWELSDAITLNVNRATAAFGTIVRAQGRDPELLPQANAARVGASGVAPGGVNVDDGNLNYARGDHVSTVLKGIIDVELKYRSNFGAFLRAKAWDDYAQRRDAVPFGNLPNNYAANTPLSDDGFSQFGRFSRVVLMDANVYGTFEIAEKALFVRLGSQTIDWTTRGSILGGLEQINVIDYAARNDHAPRNRQVALTDDSYIPVPAMFARLTLNKHTSLEAFYQFRFRPNELPGCGTFFALADYVTPGCDKVLAQPVTITDPQAIASGLFAKRAPDANPPNSGQYGFGIKYLSEIGRFGAYFANYHSRRFSPSAIKSTRLTLGGTPLIPGDPGGQNVRYFIEYPDDVKVFGLTFETLWRETGVAVEYTYRPNQSILLGSTDLFNAFASNTAPTQLRADATATPPGGIYHGYDRRKMSQLTLGGRRPFGNALEGELTLSAEVGIKYIHNLPDVDVRRYGRSDVYGLGPVNGQCTAGATPTQCSNRGFATAFSWGYRLKASTQYANVAGGVDLTPSVSFLHDVKGWSYDAIFNEGRKAAAVALRADVKQHFFVEASWSPIWGGDYNFVKDRDFYALFAGITF
jgi:hypothetical protein